MKRIWVNKTNSFKDAENFDLEYYLSMTPLERLDIMQRLREDYFRINKGLKRESRKGLRRSIKIIRQK